MQLSYGVSGVEIPDDCGAALGFRAILRGGAIDIVHDRVDRFAVSSVEMGILSRWYERWGMKWLDNQSYTMRGNKQDLRSWDDGPFHIRADTQASYGYLYVTLWMD